MRVRQLALVAFVSLTFFALVISPTAANAQSVEEAYDATLAAYNKTLNQMEECDLRFQEFQQLAKKERPQYAWSEDWEQWRKNYLFAVVIYRHCMDKLKREADNLRKKLAKLEEDLDGGGPNTRTPPKDPKSPPRSNEEEAKRTKLHRELIEVLEKRLVELEADAKRAMEEMELRMKADKASKPGFNVKTESNGRLWTATFTTPEGRLVLNLPDDLRAGDTVSGTVIANPKGQTEEERAKNLEKLNRYQLRIANQAVTGPWGEFTWSWLNPRPGWLVVPKKPTDPKPPFQPTGWALCPGQLIDCPETPHLFALLGTPSGGSGQVPFTPLAGTPIPEVFTDPLTEPELLYRRGMHLPTDGQGGHDVRVEGPFNGDMKDTEVRIGGQPATIRAESPRSCVFESPDQHVGLTEISIKENNVETKGPYRNLGVRLTAPKTSLLKGEKTTVTIEVRGLEGIQKDVPLKLESKGVINMEGGNIQNLVIRPSEVRAGGIYTTTRAITGQQAGGFGVTATVIVDRYDMCVAGFGGYLQWLSFTGEYRFRRRRGSPAGGTQQGGTQTGGTQTGGTQTGGTQTGGTQTGGTGTGEITGTGKMVMKGCIITLTHNAPDRRVFARLDACNKTGSAEVQVNPDKTKVEIKDNNTADNACGSKK